MSTNVYKLNDEIEVNITLVVRFDAMTDYHKLPQDIIDYNLEEAKLNIGRYLKQKLIGPHKTDEICDVDSILFDVI